MSKPTHAVTIPNYWTPGQAMAVADLLDELREQIWAQYQLQLLDAYRHQYQTPIPNPEAQKDDPPF